MAAYRKAQTKNVAKLRVSVMFRFSPNQHHYRFKKDNIEKIASAITQSTFPSHRLISTQTGLSLTTVGNAVKALRETGIMYENFTTLPDEQKTCGHLLFHEDIHHIVIDITTPEFSMWTVNSKLSDSSVFRYIYNPNFSEKDNLRIFFERGRAHLETRVRYFCGIVLITADGSMFTKERASDLYRPDEYRPFISDCIKTDFSQNADCVVTFGKASEYFILSDNCRKYRNHRIYYIFIGKNIISCCVDNGRHIFTCFPHDTTSFNNDAFGHGESADIRSVTDNLTSLIDHADTVIAPDTVFIDSDQFVFDSAMGKQLQKNIDRINNRAPRIIIYRSKPPLFIKGASLLLRKKLIENFLASSSDR